MLCFDWGMTVKSTIATFLTLCSLAAQGTEELWEKGEFVIYQGDTARFDDPLIARFVDKTIFQPTYQALEECGLKPRILTLPDNRASMLFSRGSIDMDLAKASRDVRFDNAIRIDTPIYRSTLYLWQGKNTKIKSLDDLENLTGVRVTKMPNNHDTVLSLTYGLDKTFQSDNVIEAPSLLAALKLLHSGRGDYLLWGNAFSTALIKKHGLSEVQRNDEIPGKSYYLHSWIAERHKSLKPCIENAYSSRFPPDIPGLKKDKTDWCAPRERSHSDVDC